MMLAFQSVLCCGTRSWIVNMPTCSKRSLLVLVYWYTSISIVDKSLMLPPWICKHPEDNVHILCVWRLLLSHVCRHYVLSNETGNYLLKNRLAGPVGVIGTISEHSAFLPDSILRAFGLIDLINRLIYPRGGRSGIEHLIQSTASQLSHLSSAQQDCCTHRTNQSTFEWPDTYTLCLCKRCDKSTQSFTNGSM